MKFIYRGREYETVGYSTRLPVGAQFIGTSGDIVTSTRKVIHEALLEVRPVRREYIFGGVKFVETGDVRPPKAGDWFMSDGRVGIAYIDWYTEVQAILKPVEVL
jgi:hypothetical protein